MSMSPGRKSAYTTSISPLQQSGFLKTSIRIALYITKPFSWGRGRGLVKDSV